MAATLDQIGGRLELGLGWGSVEEEFDRFGIETGSRRGRSQRLAETLGILELMFTGERFDYAGKHLNSGTPGAARREAGPDPDPHRWRRAEADDAIGRPIRRLGGTASPRPRMHGRARAAARISAQFPVELVHPGEDADVVRAKLLRRMPGSAWGPAVVGTPDEPVGYFADERARGVELFILKEPSSAIGSSRRAETNPSSATHLAQVRRSHQVWYSAVLSGALGRVSTYSIPRGHDCPLPYQRLCPN